MLAVHERIAESLAAVHQALTLQLPASWHGAQGPLRSIGAFTASLLQPQDPFGSLKHGLMPQRGLWEAAWPAQPVPGIQVRC